MKLKKIAALAAATGALVMAGAARRHQADRVVVPQRARGDVRHPRDFGDGPGHGLILAPRTVPGPAAPVAPPVR